MRLSGLQAAPWIAGSYALWIVHPVYHRSWAAAIESSIGWCPNFTYLLPIHTRSGDCPFWAAPGSLPPTDTEFETSLSKSQRLAPLPTVCCKAVMNSSAAFLNSAGESGLTPTNTPRAAAPSGRSKLMSTPVLLMQSIIFLLNCVISTVSPSTTTSTVFPLSGAKAASICCSWSGVITRSANRASICNLANRSCSAMRFASAARSLACAISRRNPSALAFASAECCSASARLSWALFARSFAWAIARRNPSVFASTPFSAVSAAAALSVVRLISFWHPSNPCQIVAVAPLGDHLIFC